MAQNYAVRPQFWRVMAGAAAVGIMSGLACLVFLTGEHLITSLVWDEGETPIGFFTGSWVTVAVVMLAALGAGLIRWRTGLGGDDPNFIGEMIEGEVPLKRGLQFGGLGLVSLVGDASVGPEAPLGTLGGAIGTAVGRRYERSGESTQDLTFSGIAGVTVHLVVPAVPLVVAVPALAGAVAVASVPLPMMIIVLTTMMFGLRVELSVIPAVAVVTSLVLVRGTGVLARLQRTGS